MGGVAACAKEQGAAGIDQQTVEAVEELGGIAFWVSSRPSFVRIVIAVGGPAADDPQAEGGVRRWGSRP